MSAPGPDEAELEALAAIAREAALAGGRVAMGWRGAQDLEVREKAGSDDLVSQADEDSEQTIRDTILRARPGDSILGEEQGAIAGDSGVAWLVDPIDGTTSYLYGREDWAVSVAAAWGEERRVVAGAVAEPAVGRLTEARLGGGVRVDGVPVPARGPVEVSRALIEVNFGNRDQRGDAGAMVSRLLPHVRDLRRSGSAAAALAHVAGGRADAYWGPGLQDWDVGAGLLLVAEAGAEVGDLERVLEPAARDGWDVLATAPGLREPLLGIMGPRPPGRKS